jgi:CheY-like chemotaxis protein
MGGCGFHVHRAIRIKDERRVPIRTDLLAPGTPLAFVRLVDLPRLPVVECGGRVSHLRLLPTGITLGLAFQGLGAQETALLTRFMSERVPGFRPDFPWKRRFKDLKEEEREQPQPFDAGPEPEADPPAEEPAAQAFSDTELQELRETVRDGSRLQELKKRGKKILVAMTDELGRTLLLSHLHNDGYRSIFEASSLVQALEVHRKVPLDLLILDQAVGRHGALELLETLRAQGLRSPAVVIHREKDIRLTLAAKAGGVSLLLEHPVDFQGAARAALENLLGLG